MVPKDKTKMNGNAFTILVIIVGGGILSLVAASVLTYQEKIEAYFVGINNAIVTYYQSLPEFWQTFVAIYGIIIFIAIAVWVARKYAGI